MKASMTSPVSPRTTHHSPLTKKLGSTMTTKKTMTLEQFASANRRPERQAQTLIGLKLNKIGRRSTIEDTPSTRGMLKKVSHMVRLVEPKS